MNRLAGSLGGVLGANHSLSGIESDPLHCVKIQINITMQLSDFPPQDLFRKRFQVWARPAGHELASVTRQENTGATRVMEPLPALYAPCLTQAPLSHP